MSGPRCTVLMILYLVTLFTNTKKQKSMEAADWPSSLTHTLDSLQTVDWPSTLTFTITRVIAYLNWLDYFKVEESTAIGIVVIIIIIIILIVIKSVTDLGGNHVFTISYKSVTTNYVQEAANVLPRKLKNSNLTSSFLRTWICVQKTMMELLLRFRLYWSESHIGSRWVHMEPNFMFT